MPIELALARCASEFLLWAGSSASDGKGDRSVDFSRLLTDRRIQLEFELSNDTIDGLVVDGFMMIYLKPFPLLIIFHLLRHKSQANLGVKRRSFSSDRINSSDEPINVMHHAFSPREVWELLFFRQTSSSPFASNLIFFSGK